MDIKAVKRAVRRRHTKPCKYFQIGSCPRSDSECDFAHVRTLNINTEMYQRTPPCRFHHQRGYCRNGVNCRFSHAAEEPFVPPDSGGYNEKQEGHCPENYQYPRGILFSPVYPTPPAMPLSPEVYPYAFWPRSPYDPYYPTLAPLPQYPEDLPYALYQPDSISPSGSFDSSISASLATVSSPSHSEDVVPDECADHFIPGSADYGQAYQSNTTLGQQPFPSMSPFLTPIIPTVPLSSYSMPAKEANAHQKPTKPPKPRSIKPKPVKFKTKKCKFYKPDIKFCPNGEACTFIHGDPEAEHSLSPATASSPELKSIEVAASSNSSGSPPGLPPKPITNIEDKRRKNFFPITWRVIGGGVLMGIRKPDQEPSFREKSSALDSMEVSSKWPQTQKGESTSIAFPSDLRQVPQLSIDVNFPVLQTNRDTSPTRAQRGRATSSPSTPSTIHVDVPTLFSAETP